ncbi:hypothetical protein N9Y92_00985 [Chlamydiales bacterium]|nr:hypothetical protein [Chlamydiales bacterium]
MFQSKEFQSLAALPAINPESIFDYNYIAYMQNSYIKDLNLFLKKYPGLLLIDSACKNYFQDKYATSTLFTEIPSLIEVKPKWGLYKKEYSKNLAHQIQKEINSAIYVIKPRNAFKGNGVIITSKEDLNKTLKTILLNNKTLSNHPDRGYRYWSKNRSDSFLVEEFIYSDLITIPEYNNQLFNGTMRLAVALIYHNNDFQLHFLGEYWNIPDKSINEPGSLNDKHKTSLSSLHKCKIDPHTAFTVKKSLTKPLLLLYKRLLGFDIENIENGLETSIITGY